MAAFDYSTVAKLVPTKTDAELSPAKSRRHGRHPVGYGRFARAADAIRFAIEELPPELLSGTFLEVAEERFDQDGIRLLYDDAAYPLARRAAPPRPMKPGRRSKTASDTDRVRAAGRTEAVDTSRHRGAA
jgi:Arc/MetJ-type ribon-helix-helix transcriptional regulator